MLRLAPVVLGLGPLIALAGCTLDWDRVSQQGHDLPSLTTGSTGDGATTPDASTSADASTADDGTTSGAATTVSTATSGGSASDGATGTTGDDDGKAVPVEVEVILNSPSPMLHVGEVQVSVWTSRPVASIDVFDGDVPLVLGAAPANPVHVFEVTSDVVPGDGTHTLRAVAHAADGVSGEGMEELMIDVQPGGSDVWPPYVKAGPINGFTSAAMLGNGIAVAGFFETNDDLEAVAVRVDGTKGQPEGSPIHLGPVAVSGGGRGPAIAVGDDDAAFVAWTFPDKGSTRWAVSRVKFGEPKEQTWIGLLGTSVNALIVVDDSLVLVGADEVKPGTHDLKVWWVSATGGEQQDERTFAASPAEDKLNDWDEVARGVALVGDEIVVVGERMTKNEDDVEVQRTVVLRYGLDGASLGAWTSPGELMDEDVAMAVAPLREGGFVVTGWGRDLGFKNRLLLTRWFTAAGAPGPVRIEPSSSDSVGYAVGEDREGKIIVAGAAVKPLQDADSWILAIPGPAGAPAWEVVRSGPGQGPDEAAGLAIDSWGYVYVAGSEFGGLQPQAFALRLYP
ncbi:hypothetical protein [Nannocystis bainbridge]|uniref:Lipoprotein n=1 Tax=Nannocystis bainbridge TaxID=2995303 RepID=A0ABT5DXD4_9BACT|nr:hypothetical protein [Nannocystis bainbridge]MDC0717774.1 hypothetical protein [Nannocystis bainbridge]